MFKKILMWGFRGLVRWYWWVFGIVFLMFFGLFALAVLGLLGEMPSFEVLENPDTKLATEILSDDGQTFGKIYIEDNRTPVSYEELSPFLINALIATEDERFFEHSGIDVMGFLRALVFLGGKGGGSTISQQLGRQLFVGVRSRNLSEAIIQKIKEWVIAVQLERSYTKEEIIAMYFNIYDFSNQADGIKSASRIYFNKTPKTLTIEEAATLVGMFKNSTLYNPIRNPEGVTNRRNVVLKQMYRNGHISENEIDSLLILPLKIDFHPERHDRGIATYFREYVRGFLKKWISENPKPDGKYHNLYKDGLKIYTTINLKMQTYAEEAMRRHMKNLQEEFSDQLDELNLEFEPFLGVDKSESDHIISVSMRRTERWRHMRYDLKKSKKDILNSFQEPQHMRVFSWKGDIDTIMTPLDSILYYKHFLRSGLLSIEPQSGHIKAWVGGIDYRHFKYDQVVQGYRQTGSIFKPFVYATAMDQLRLSPCYEIPDVMHCIEAGKYGNREPWCPNNSNDVFSGKMVTLKEALARSINTVTATLIDKVGPLPVVDMVKKLGVKSKVLPVPSIALGTADLKLIEVVDAYATFANMGIHIDPSFITRIEDKNGTVLYESKHETRDVLSEDISHAVLSLMEGVTQYGSGARLRGDYMKDEPYYKKVVTGYPYEFTNPIAGKTGTSQNNSDGWFLGIVPNLVTGVWVGGEDRAIHFPSTRYGQGATMALPIWACFMKSCYQDEDLYVSAEEFTRPDKETINTDCGEDTPYSTTNNPFHENKDDDKAQKPDIDF